MKKLLPLLGLLASACRPCTKLPLSAEDRAWMAAYPRVGQEITFRSNRGHAATYRVAERVDTYNAIGWKSARRSPRTSTSCCGPPPTRRAGPTT